MQGVGRNAQLVSDVLTRCARQIYPAQGVSAVMREPIDEPSEAVADVLLIGLRRGGVVLKSFGARRTGGEVSDTVAQDAVEPGVQALVVEHLVNRTCGPCERILQHLVGQMRVTHPSTHKRPEALDIVSQVFEARMNISLRHGG